MLRLLLPRHEMALLYFKFQHQRRFHVESPDRDNNMMYDTLCVHTTYSASFVINADSCIVKVQGFIYFTLTCRISPPHLTSSGTVFFLTPQLLLRRRSARCARLPPAQSLCHVYYDEFFGSPKKNFANERGFDFLDRRTDGQTDRRTGILPLSTYVK